MYLWICTKFLRSLELFTLEHFYPNPFHFHRNCLGNIRFHYQTQWLYGSFVKTCLRMWFSVSDRENYRASLSGFCKFLLCIVLIILLIGSAEDGIIPGRLVPEVCHAEAHTDYGGIAVRWGLTHHVESAADCCEACLKQARTAKSGEKKCNIWVFCPAEGGCFSPDVYEHKHQECWLKQVIKRCTILFVDKIDSLVFIFFLITYNRSKTWVWYDIFWNAGCWAGTQL